MPSTAAGRYPDRMPLQWDPDGPARGRVVLLHGMTSLSATWWRIGPGLAARGWQVVAPDLPGHGTAARLSGPLDLDPLVEGVASRLPATIGLHGPLLWDPATLLPLVRVPVLVLAAPDAPPGTFDQDGGTALRGHDRRAVQALVPPDRFVVLDGSHCLHRDQPDRWLESVSAFADTTLGS
jgi:pimeloyl-ACP methyl ester carboxylesterase